MHAIGVAARLSGVGIETIRYYERTGVVPKPPRSGSGRRLYDSDAIGRLRFIRRCRDLGFPLVDARALLDLEGEGEGEGTSNVDVCSEVRGLGEDHLQSVRAKMADLKRLERALEQLIKPCATPNARCPALQALYSAEAVTGR